MLFQECLAGKLTAHMPTVWHTGGGERDKGTAAGHPRPRDAQRGGDDRAGGGQAGAEQPRGPPTRHGFLGAEGVGSRATTVIAAQVWS